MRILIGASVMLVVSGIAYYSATQFRQPPAIPQVLQDYLMPTPQSLDRIASNWNSDSAIKLLETSRFVKMPSVRRKIFSLLEHKTGQSLGADRDAWYHWIWEQQQPLMPDYAVFKRELYRHIDNRFEEYFATTYPATIRLDEIRWGGVVRDGIPPLDRPEMIQAKSASYLGANDTVFGIEINGDVRCYPKRILAWHEMFKDTIGGVSVCGVY